MNNDPLLLVLFEVVIGILVLASVITTILYSRQRSKGNVNDSIKNLAARTKAWWIIVGVMVGSVLTGPNGLFVFYTLLSALALREFISAIDTRITDHRTLAWIFFFVLPLHYLFAATGWYVMFLIFIPVYCFVLIPARMAVAGDSTSFLVRSATIQWGVLICVYFISYLPMLLHLSIPGLPEKSPRLLFYLVLITQMSDVLQYTAGKLFGKHKLAPNISPNKTTEGLVIGGLLAVALGTSLWWITPFQWFGAVLIATVIVVAGFLGGLVMSAIKRDLQVKDWGRMIAGHGGVLDRMDSLIFSAPIYFHIVVYYSDAVISKTPPAWMDSILRFTF